MIKVKVEYGLNKIADPIILTYQLCKIGYRHEQWYTNLAWHRKRKVQQKVSGLVIRT